MFLGDVNVFCDCSLRMNFQILQGMCTGMPWLHYYCITTNEKQNEMICKFHKSVFDGSSVSKKKLGLGKNIGKVKCTKK